MIQREITINIKIKKLIARSIYLLFGSCGGIPGFGKCPAQHGLPIRVVVVVDGGLILDGLTIDAFDFVDFVSLLTDSVSDRSTEGKSLIFDYNYCFTLFMW